MMIPAAAGSSPGWTTRCPVVIRSLATATRSRAPAVWLWAASKSIRLVTRMGRSLSVSLWRSLQLHQHVEHVVGGGDHLADRLEGALRLGQVDHLLVQRHAG